MFYSLPLYSFSFLHNEGQNVHSINRIFVQASILQSFKEKFIRVVQRLKIGSPHEINAQVRKTRVQLNWAFTVYSVTDPDFGL